MSENHPVTSGFSPLVLLTVVAAACASGSSGGQIESPGAQPRLEETSTGFEFQLTGGDASRVELPAAPGRVWTALVEAYTQLGIKPDVVNPSTRTYGVERFSAGQLAGKRTADYVRCAFEGAGPSMAGGYRTQLVIMSTLRPLASGSTVLETQVTGSARSVEGTSTSPVRCGSTGEIEQRIATLVREGLTR